jgi:hypothetical protein
MLPVEVATIHQSGAKHSLHQSTIVIHSMLPLRMNTVGMHRCVKHTTVAALSGVQRSSRQEQGQAAMPRAPLEPSSQLDPGS